MTGLTGTRFLVGFALRRERLRMAAWIVGITALVLLTTASIRGVYPTQADLDAAARASVGNAAAIAFNGPAQGLDTVGGEVAFQVGTFALILVALMSLLMVTRCTRAEEESGRTELLRATPLGRDAQTAAALIVVTVMNLVLGLAVASGLAAEGLPAVGAASFGASLVAIGLVFTALALVTTQITENGRTASGLAGILLGCAFVLRAVGDIHDGRLSWLSPIGWSQKLRPFAGERWWPLLVPLVATALLLVAARALTSRRDWGAGLISSRPGPARAVPRLGSPLGLAVRFNRGSLIAWCASVLVLGFVYGSIANDIGTVIGGNTTLKDLLAAGGGASLVDAYFGTALLVLALVACCFPVQAVYRVRSEETSSHAELLLATPLARARWLVASVVVACCGSALVLAAGALGAGVPYAIAVGRGHQVLAVLGAALAYLPALCLVAAAAVALFGLRPGILGAVWVGLVGCFVIGFLGEVLKLPSWIMKLSPFEQVPRLPAAPVSVTPLALQAATALLLTVLGVMAFERRDLG